MRELLYALNRWWAFRRTQRRWRDIKTLLIVFLCCALCNLANLACGLTAYTLQRLGLLPTATPLP